MTKLETSAPKAWAFHAGMTAYGMGIALSANPYTADADREDEWKRGWQRAQKRDPNAGVYSPHVPASERGAA